MRISQASLQFRTSELIINWINKIHEKISVPYLDSIQKSSFCRHKHKTVIHHSDEVTITDMLLTCLCCVHERIDVHKFHKYISCPQHAEVGVVSNYSCVEKLDDTYDTGKDTTVKHETHCTCSTSSCILHTLLTKRKIIVDIQ